MRETVIRVATVVLLAAISVGYADTLSVPIQSPTYISRAIRGQNRERARVRIPIPDEVRDTKVHNDIAQRNVSPTDPPRFRFDPEWTLPDDGHTIYGACVVDDTLLFVAHGYYAPNRIVIYKIGTLAKADSFDTPQVSPYGYMDFWYSKNEGVLYAGAIEFYDAFNRWDAHTHAYLGRVSITGSQTPGAYCVAITGRDDSLFISGFWGGVYKCAADGTNSHLVGPTPPSIPVIGLALDQTHDVMYVRLDLGRICLFSMDPWALVLDTILPNAGGWGGCELFHGDTFLVVAADNPSDEVHCYRLIPSHPGIAADNGPLRITDCGLRIVPNPSSGVTVVSFSLPSSDNISLKLYRVTGAEVTTLVKGYHKADAYSLPCDAHSLPKGIYLLRLETGHSTTEQKLILE